MGLIKKIKNSNKPLLGQILDLIPGHILSSVVKKHKSDKYCKSYKTRDELVAMLLGQLNGCNTLRDITTALNVSGEFLDGIGLDQSPARSTMSSGNAKRSWEVFEDLFTALLSYYARMFRKTEGYKVIKELEGKQIKIIDSSTISLCLQLFDWAKFRTAKGAIKIHTCLDEATEIPELVYISDGKMHDRKGIDHLTIQDKSILIDDRGYFDFSLFVKLIVKEVTFVTRIKDNTVYKSVRELDLPEDRDFHILKDEIIRLTGAKAYESTICDHHLRRVVVYDQEKNSTIEIITNNLALPAWIISDLYKRRWKIETFFKHLKQNLQVKTFIGTSENACKSQIYIALIAYTLLEFIRRHISKVNHGLKQFVNLIRICLMHYQGLNYIVNQVTHVSCSNKQKKPEETGQTSLKFTS